MVVVFNVIVIFSSWLPDGSDTVLGTVDRKLHQVQSFPRKASFQEERWVQNQDTDEWEPQELLLEQEAGAGRGRGAGEIAMGGLPGRLGRVEGHSHRDLA